MTESEQERRIYRKCEMAIGVTFMTLAIVLTVLVLTELSPINWLDVGWATWLGDHRREWIEDTALTLSQLGSGGVMWPVIGVTIVALAYTRRSEALAVFALTILSAQLFVGPLKA